MKRQISFGQALATVVGSVIGAGVFFKIGTITAQTGSSSTTIFVWILAGVISIASGLTISEIAASLKIMVQLNIWIILMAVFGAFYLAGHK